MGERASGEGEGEGGGWRGGASGAAAFHGMARREGEGEGEGRDVDLLPPKDTGGRGREGACGGGPEGKTQRSPPN